MELPASVVEVLAAHRFDEGALAEYLRPRLEGVAQGLRVRQFQSGQSNPTFLLEAGGRRYVLRKKPPGKLLPSAHQIEREYKVLKALAGTGVPVPPVHLLCEDPQIIGTAFYVMDYVPGRLYGHPRLTEAPRAERAAIYEAMADTLARLHAVDWQAVGLADFGRPSGYVERQIKRWSGQYEASRTGEMPAMEKLMTWLPEHMPAEDETAIAHGDFRPGNLLIHPERAEVVAVLDWELATLGHPLADLAYCCMPYHLPAGVAGIKGLAGLDLAAENLPPESQFLAAYRARSGRGEIPHWNFFLAFSLFRLTAILQGVYHRALQGNASNADALQVGERAGVLAEAGWQLAQQA